MKRTSIAVALVVLVLTTTRASEKTYSAFSKKTGNDLLQVCKVGLRDFDNRGAYLTELSACDNYITGFTDAISYLQLHDRVLPPVFCIPAEVTGVQKVRVMVNYLEAHTANLHLPAAFLAPHAFEDAFPCPRG